MVSFFISPQVNMHLNDQDQVKCSPPPRLWIETGETGYDMSHSLAKKKKSNRIPSL